MVTQDINVTAVTSTASCIFDTGANGTSAGTGSAPGDRIFGNPLYDTLLVGDSICLIHSTLNKLCVDPLGVQITAAPAMITKTTGDASVTTGGNVTHTVGGDFALTTTTGNSTIATGGDVTHTVGGDFALTTTGDTEIITGGSSSSAVTGNYQLTTTGDTVLDVGNLQMTSKGTATIGATGKITLTSGPNPIVLPLTVGTAGQILTTDGSGNLSWIDRPVGGMKTIKVITSSVAGTFLSILGFEPSWVEITITGGGGSGASGEDNAGEADCYGGSGGAGGTVIAYINTFDDTYSPTISIGAGGGAVAGTNVAGNIGGNSSFVYNQYTIIAYPGNGGRNTVGQGAPGGIGYSTVSESIRLTGGDGSAFQDAYSSGVGGASYFGGGGAGDSADSGSGAAARCWGSGGGGNAGDGQASGAGMQGICILRAG